MSAAQITSGTMTVNVSGTPSGAAFRVTKHPELTQSVIDGAMFTGSNPLATPVTTQAGLSATTPCLTLHNPVGSGVNIILQSVNIALAAAPAANSQFCLAFNTAVPTALTVADVTSNIIGNSATPQGKCSRIATLSAAPVEFAYLGGILAASSTGNSGISRTFNGEYAIQPGAAVSIQTTTAASVLASIVWKEIAIGAQ